jgi:G:T-mismatch repair DNA endonuclease (very short patch repair protein)
MKNTPIRDTPAELALRRAVFRRGLRYRVDTRPVASARRRADIVFSRFRERGRRTRWLYESRALPLRIHG